MLCTKCGSSNPDQASFCRSCGNALESTTPATGGAQFSSSAQFSGGATATAAVSADNYAGFWLRFAALFLDGFVLNLILLPIAIIFIVAAVVSGASESSIGILGNLISLLSIPISAAYFITMESGEKGATFGKRWVNIRVVDMQGNRISKGTAFARWIGHLLSYITLYIGFFMQPFTAKKQALHDMVAGTVVIKTEGKSNNGAIIAIIIAFFVLVMIAVVGILAAIAIPAYQDYVSKAKVAKVVSIGEAATIAFDSYYAQTGKVPASLEEMNANIQTDPDISDVSINPENGEIVITFTEGLSSALSGNHIRMMPSVEADGQLSWQCSSNDIKQIYLPKQCK